MKLISSHRLVKSEDLNHHGTLFAGRGAEWFVESGFIAASKYLNPKYVICLKIHGMHFSKPVRPGEVIVLKSAIVYAGRTSLTAHVDVYNAQDESIVDGFITFVHVDEYTRSSPHGIIITPETEDDRHLWEEARRLLDNK
jgi:acyl-CoA hydrolase